MQHSLALKKLLAAALLAATVLVAIPAGTARAENYACTPADVAVFTVAGAQRMHVRCTTPYPGSSILFFAFPTRTARRKVGGDVEFVPNSHADRYLAMATAALVNNRQLGIWFDMSDLSGSRIGCGNADCRLLVAMSID